MASNRQDPDLGLVHKGPGNDLAGTIERVIFYNEESLYCVASLDTGKGLVTAAGNMGRVKPGEKLILKGRFGSHPKYGRRFLVSSFKVIPPKEEEGIKAYLGSGLIKGIGPAMAERIVDKFGAGTLEVMDSDPEALLQISGIGRKKLKQIKLARSQRREMEGLGLFLRSHGLPASLAIRLFKRYGDRGLALVRANPYLLIQDMPGIGFKKADAIASSLGHGPDSDQRLAAGLLHLLREAANHGDCYLPRQVLLQKAIRLLEVRDNLILPALDQLIKRKQLFIEKKETVTGSSKEQGGAVYLPRLLAAERDTAGFLLKLIDRPGPLKGKNPGPILDRIAKGSELTLSPEQQEALSKVFSSKVLVVTGGPGTGKTTLIKAMVSLFRSQGIKPALAAPTGRAAKRLSLAAGESASTIHRLLEYAPQEGFMRNRENRLPHKAVLIDELSMVDIQLMASLVEAVNAGASLILMGDADQLPAVGPGRVLGDLIGSGRIQVVRLNKIFRQAEGSSIIANAHRIRKGRPLLLDQGEDFYFIEQADPLRAAEIVVKLVEERIPNRFGFDPMREIQVLSPMRKGVCGVEALNQELRQALNPLGKAVGRTGFRLGDKVIQTRNNYERMTFNGDLGLIRSELGRGQFLIDMEGETKTYEGEGLAELSLAYCLSIHKSQGSEYPAVIIPILSEHTIMLKRNLIYTALTRARRLAVLVGSAASLKAALARRGQDRRRTLLGTRLGVM